MEKETTLPAALPPDLSAIEKILITGNLSGMTPEQRVEYVRAICQSVGINPLTRPFDYMVGDGGKLILYANRTATDQLRMIRGVSVEIVARENRGPIYCVTARAKDATGRVDEATGAVSLEGLKGGALANAYMKAETKAKRRVTLSLCGLGIPDESEIETIPGARPEPRDVRSEQAPTVALPAPAAPKTPRDNLLALLRDNHWTRENMSAYRSVRFPKATGAELAPGDVLTWLAEFGAAPAFADAMARARAAMAPKPAPTPFDDFGDGGDGWDGGDVSTMI